MKWPLLKSESPKLPSKGSVGDFAFKRSFYMHSGIDLYCDAGQEVVAIESGTVINIDHFTGADSIPSSPWWNDTWSIMIEGESGVIGYCELDPVPILKIGSFVNEGDIIGSIIPVLKKVKISEIGDSMLHVELYKYGTKEHVTWLIDTEKPEDLLDPRYLLELIMSKN